MNGITWRQTGEQRWTGEDQSGNVLRVSESSGVWKWSLYSTYGGYTLNRGQSCSRDEAMEAAEQAHQELARQIDAAHEERLRRKRRQ